MLGSLTPRPEYSAEVMIKPASEPGGSIAADEDFARRLQASQGRGRPLPPSLRETFEARFGADFGAVKVHSDAAARQLSQAIQAQAFTRGSDIFLGAGNSAADRRLLAHELTHVVQQGAAPLKTTTAPLQPARPRAAAHYWIRFGPGSVSGGEPGNAGVITAPDLHQPARPGAEGTIQRKIEKGKLNVVGETHSQSEPRRDREKAMLKAWYELPERLYWTEDEFEGANGYGDRPHYIAVQFGVYILHYSALLQETIQGEVARQKVQPLSFGWDEVTREPVRRLAAKLAGALDAFVEECEKGRDPETRSIIELARRIRTEFPGDYPGAAVYGAYDDLQGVPPERRYKQLAVLDQQLTKLQKLFWPLLVGNFDLPRESIVETFKKMGDFVSETRSGHMLQAAERSGKIGVWKVGEDHLKDMMIKFGGGTDQTKLTSRAEFNRVFDEWETDREWAQLLKKNPEQLPLWAWRPIKSG